MGHTNSTPNIGLPQFIGTDKPTWLGDVNGAMSTIDTKIGSIDAAIATTDAKADNAVADASGAVTTATNAANTAGNASTTATQANNLATQALTVANNTADLCTNQIVPDVAANTSAIGDLSDLDTTDKSNLVAAINEVAQGGGGGSAAWSLVGSQQGTTPIALTGNESELYVCVKYNNNIYFSAVVVAAVLTSTEQQIIDGYYSSANAAALVNVGVTNSQVVLKAATIDGVAHLSDTTISVYSR